MSGELMTLDEAIAHCLEKGRGGDLCAQNHMQLAEWLSMYKALITQIDCMHAMVHEQEEHE